MSLTARLRETPDEAAAQGPGPYLRFRTQPKRRASTRVIALLLVWLAYSADNKGWLR